MDFNKSWVQHWPLAPPPACAGGAARLLQPQHLDGEAMKCHTCDKARGGGRPLSADATERVTVHLLDRRLAFTAKYVCTHCRGKLRAASCADLHLWGRED